MSSFNIGDLVWAKMKGFPPWPGRVTESPKDKKTPKKSSSQWIYFFGSNNYGWIENSSIKPYHEFKESLWNANKTAPFREACNAIEEYIAKGDNSIVPGVEPSVEDAFDNLVKSTPTPKVKKPKKSETPKSESGKSDSTADTPRGDDSPDGKDSEKKIKSVKSSEKKTKSKRSVSPSVNGETPTKRKKIVEAAVSSKAEPKEDPIMTVYKEKSGEDKKSGNGEATASPIPNVTRISMDNSTPPSTLKFGFLGLGIMGSRIVSNLLDSGHKVVVWNRTLDKAEALTSKGAEICKTPAEVVYASDITYCCVADPTAAKEVVFGPSGVLSAMDATKGYVELTTIDVETSLDTADGVRSKGGRYLEAQIQGNKEEAGEGSLVVMCAGDRSLYDDTQTCFIAMANCSFFLGDAGNAAKMNLVIQLIRGVTVGALAEGMALADRAGLRQADVLEIMSYTNMQSPLVMSKAKQIVDSLFHASMPLRHMQKDLALSLALGDNVEHPLPLTAAANEIYKHAKQLGYATHDDSAVYIRARF